MSELTGRDMHLIYTEIAFALHAEKLKLWGAVPASIRDDYDAVASLIDERYIAPRDARIAELERIMAEQRARIVELEQEITTLHAALKALQQKRESGRG